MDRNSRLDSTTICTVVGALIAMAIGDALGLSHIIGMTIGDALGLSHWSHWQPVSIGRLVLAGLGSALGMAIGEYIKRWRSPDDNPGPAVGRRPDREPENFGASERIFVLIDPPGTRRCSTSLRGSAQRTKRSTLKFRSGPERRDLPATQSRHGTRFGEIRSCRIYRSEIWQRSDRQPPE